MQVDCPRCALSFAPQGPFAHCPRCGAQFASPTRPAAPTGMASTLAVDPAALAAAVGSPPHAASVYPPAGQNFPRTRLAAASIPPPSHGASVAPAPQNPFGVAPPAAQNPFSAGALYPPNNNPGQFPAQGGGAPALDPRVNVPSYGASAYLPNAVGPYAPSPAMSPATEPAAPPFMHGQQGYQGYVAPYREAPRAPVEKGDQAARAVLTTVLGVVGFLGCCNPFGLVAIVMGLQSYAAVNRGDEAFAERYSKNARIVAWLGILTSATVWLIVGMMIFAR